MPVPTLKLTGDAQSAGGKGSFAQRVQSAEDVALLLPRLTGKPKLLTLAYNALGSEDGAVWIWGERSFGIADVVDTVLYGRIVSVGYLRNEPGFSIKTHFAPLVEAWGRERGAVQAMTFVHKEGPWERLTGWKPWALIIAKEL